jgi:FkbM family methyltransferase
VNVRGVPLELHPPPDYLSDEVRRTGDFYEANILDAVRAYLARLEPGVLVDVGAMIGNHTAYLCAFVPHTAVVAFEPVPANFELLRVNAPRAEAYRVALSDAPGAGAIVNDDPLNRGHGRLMPGHDVFVATLDSFRLRGVSLIKVDVEGEEPAVISGAWHTIVTDRPLLLVEDWTGRMAVATYQRVEAWPDQQTYLFAPA